MVGDISAPGRGGAGSAARDLEAAQDLEGSGEHALALAAYEDLVSGGEDGMEIRHGLGCVLHRLGDVDGAIRNLRLALGMGDALPSWLGLATVIPGAPSANQEDILSARAGLSRRLLQDHRPTEFTRPGKRNPGDSPIRVGFVSAFFHRPNYMKPVWGLLNRLSREEVDVHLFSDAPGGGDWVGYRPSPRDKVHTTLNMNNRGLAQLIRRQELDVLVDLNAYSVAGRIPLLLEPHAPIVLGWFNAFATYGLPGIDAIVGDREVITAREEAHFAEEVRRLPQSYLTFSVPYPTPSVSPPPASSGNPFTFGCLAPQYKITPPVLDLWAAILNAAQESRLFLANPALDSLHNRAWVLERFVERGVSTNRVIFGRPGPHESFLRQYGFVDVVLDTFPYSGGVTTMESLWQGVPVLTLEGNRWAGRTSRSLLRFAGLDEWVLSSPESLMNRAVQLARAPGDSGYLSSLRSEMRTRLSASSVCDTKKGAEGFTRLLFDLVGG